jgi:hypothetical protein
MEVNHDALRHLRYLRQSLSQDNEAIGIFISAGCPLSVAMPEGAWPLIPDVVNLTRFINGQLAGNAKYQTLLSELIKSGRNSDNIEEVLSFVRSLALVSKGGNVRGLDEEDLLELESTICTEIVKRVDVTFPKDETPYHRLCNWIRSIDRRTSIELFTTNYDLLTEQALEDYELPYFDGFVGSRRSFFDLRAVEDNLIPPHWTRLWKIHGSINWHQEFQHGQRRVYRSSEVKTSASHLIYPSHLKYEESRKMPYLALIDQLNRFVRKKSSLLILCGYSFGDDHLNDTIVNALKANPTAMALGLMYGTYQTVADGGETCDRYPKATVLAKRQHNLNLWTFDKAIIGTNTGRWAYAAGKDDGDVDLLSFVASEQVTGDQPSTRTLVRLGDFAVFTDFLKRIIGTSRTPANEQ